MNNDSISVKIRDDITLIINPGDRLDNSNANDMVKIICQAQSDGYKYIMLDFAGLEFISSSGVGSILGTIETSRNQGGDIIIYCASPKIMRVFEALDLSEYLTFCETEEKALKIEGN